VTWIVLIALAVGNFALKWIGATLLARKPLPARYTKTVNALPLAIYPALVASATFGGDSVGVQLDARLVSTAVVLVVLIIFRKRSLFGVAMLVGAGMTALLRFLLR
jgi:branched-subunit amino acid transport protein